MRLAVLGILLLWGDVSQDRRHLGYYCGRARFGSASSLHGLPALRVLFTWRRYKGTMSVSEAILRMCCALTAGGDFLPSLSTGEVSGWLDFATDWLHFTRSAQLGPVWESRAALSTGGGPLRKINTQREDKQCVAGGIFNVFTPFHLISEQLLQPCTWRTLQQPEESAYLTLQHYEIARDCIGQRAFHHDQYPFPAASDYRAVHILSGCFSSL